MKLEEIKEMANLAEEILKSTPYSEDKTDIRKFFEKDFGFSYQEIVKIRLTVIDSYYSTNMSMRYYGIKELEERITEKNFSSSDNELKRKIELFKENWILQIPKSLHFLMNLMGLRNQEKMQDWLFLY